MPISTENAFGMGFGRRGDAQSLFVLIIDKGNYRDIGLSFVLAAAQGK
jgi:hypothetical protein